MANFYLSGSLVGRNTMTVHIPSAGIYGIDGKTTLPKTNAGSAVNSSIVVTINLNGSPVYVGAAGIEGFHTAPLCAANDIITIVHSSANVEDQGLNVVKSTISISEGV